MFQLEKSRIEFVEGDAVIPAREYAAVVEADQIVAAAHAEAETIRREAAEEYERRREQGYQEGMEKGKAEMAEQMVAYMSQSAAYFSKVEGVLIDVVMKSVRRVLGEFDQGDLVGRVVKRALEKTRNEGHITVRVTPAQAEQLQSRLSAILESVPKIEFLEVVADSRVGEGGCILETEIGIVDASLESQLKAIENALVNAMK